MHNFPLMMIFVLISLFITAGILVAGIWVNSRGGDLNRKYGNLLMRLRVYAQGITLILFAIVLITR